MECIILTLCTEPVTTVVKKDADIDYLGAKYRFILVERKLMEETRYVPSSSVYQMMDWFGLSKCFVLSPCQSAITSQSVRRVLYSATVCAAEALHCSTPVLVVSSTVDALHRAREILGYALLTPQNSRGGGGDNVRTVHYESAVLEGVAPKHVLFYLDGMIGLFRSKLSEFSVGSHPLPSLLGLANVKEKYFYRLSENDRFLTRSVAYNNDHKKLRFHPEIQSCIEDLAAALPDRDDTSASLNKLVIEVDYGVRRFGRQGSQHHNVDDNEFYTTLHPSTLPHHSWEVRAEFLPLRNSSDVAPQGLAFCLRQLLALYIAGKCCNTDQNVVNMSGKNGDFPAVDRAKALAAATILSISSRDAVSAVCSNPQPLMLDDNGNPLGSGGSIPQDLLMRVFSRSMWIDVDTRQASPDGAIAATATADNTAREPEVKASTAEKSQCYGVATSPWNWMANLRGSPVGSWLNLVAVYTGSLPDFSSMCYFWAECCHQLRVHAETGVPIPRLHPPQPVSAPSQYDLLGRRNCTSSLSLNRSADGDCEALEEDAKPELWQQNLWDDVLEDRAGKRMPFSLPDTHRCLIFQKLQMLQLCILCGEEKVTVKRPLVVPESITGTSVGSVVSPVCVDTSDHRNSNECGATFLSQATRCHSEPLLQRRLPMTTDMNAHTQYLQEKLTSGRSRTGNENPLLRWQVTLPFVVSDVRAFKAANEESSFEDFLNWYSPCTLSTVTLQEIWTFSSPAHADEQNALFKAEKETEKVLGYLESLTPCQLTAEMLCTAMMSMHMVLYYDLLGAISSADGGRLHYDKLAGLYEDISTAVSMIREDCPSLHENPDRTISQHALLAVDKVCATIQSMEEMKARADSCRLQFDEKQSRLRTELSLFGTASAINQEEAKHLFHLSKNASRGDNHSWHSVDGRELGAPDVKVFELWALPEGIPDQLPQALETGEPSVQFLSTKHVREFLETSEDHQRLHATAAGDDLRVSLILRESSHV